MWVDSRCSLPRRLCRMRSNRTRVPSRRLRQSHRHPCTSSRKKESPETSSSRRPRTTVCRCRSHRASSRSQRVCRWTLRPCTMPSASRCFLRSTRRSRRARLRTTCWLHRYRSAAPAMRRKARTPRPLARRRPRRRRRRTRHRATRKRARAQARRRAVCSRRRRTPPRA